ncbi:MAG: fibronectin type III domain-containing protein [Candidatus Cloacimonetes bacterium]|nr:fibronectin type III domain-containing protein [Candidatus Cloacimonadota bacterium]
MKMFNRNLLLGLFLAVLLMFALSCERRGSLNTNIPPTVQITSYEGVDPESSDTPADTVVFKQKIFFNGYDPDGTVEGYAYRVKNLDGTPVLGTPGNEATDENGWIYHYREGADQSIPLSSNMALKSIWSKLPYAIINFPTPDSVGVVPIQTTQVEDEETGEITYVDTDWTALYAGKFTFEVKCIDNRGTESTSAAKNYTTSSMAHRVSISSLSGTFKDDKTSEVGTAIILQFYMAGDVDIPYIDDHAYYYKYKVEKIDPYTEQLIGNPVQVYSTQNTNNINAVFLSLNEEETNMSPRFTLDYNESGALISITKVTAVVVNEAGVESEPSSVYFRVKPGFYPDTRIYFDDCLFYGNMHFSTIQMAHIRTRLEPFVSSQGFRYQMPLFTDFDGNLVAVTNDNSLRGFMHWGYHGEFGKADNPQTTLPYESIVYDERTDTDYKSAITFYDLRINGQPYVYPGLPSDIFNIIDKEGKEWLRVPVSSPISNKATLANLTPGDYVFEVRAVDLAGEEDRTPAILHFKVVAPTPIDQREGILYVNGSNNYLNVPTHSAYLDSLQNHINTIFPDMSFDIVDRASLDYDTYLMNSTIYHKLSLSDLLKYKFVIYDSQELSDTDNIFKESIPMHLYILNGGNVLYNYGKNVFLDWSNNQADVMSAGFDFLLGFELSEESLMEYSPNFGSFPNSTTYFIDAIPYSNTYPQLNLNLESHPTLAFTQGLGPISYIQPDRLYPNAEIIYNFGCKDPGDLPYLPSQFEKEFWETKVVGLKSTNQYGNKVYSFTFPFAYMDISEVNQLIETIINEL